MAENSGQLPPEELALIKGYYEKVMQLLRYNKNKDEAIDRLSKQNEQYRADFCQFVYRPLAMSLIDMRENCKRELAGMVGREYAPERLRRNFGLLAEELESIITDNGGEITEGDVLFDGRSVLKPYQPLISKDEELSVNVSDEPAAEQVVTEQVTTEEVVTGDFAAEKSVNIDKIADNNVDVTENVTNLAVDVTEGITTTEEDVEIVTETVTDEVPAPTLAEVLDGYQKQITQILSDNSVLENTLKEALTVTEKIDAENKFRLIYPVIKGLYKYICGYRKKYGWLYEGGCTADDMDPENAIYNDPAALKAEYMQALGGVVEELLDILEKLGVTTVNNIDGKFDPACQQIAKSIPTDAEEDDRKVANYVTDGYLLGGKLIYRQKVDIYKFKRQ